jgi:protein involved in polysaccharide export with SLBB domain
VPSNVVNEVYVLGAIDSPGQTGVTDSLTALGAITVRGGFSPNAWKKQVLVVRDSLSENPKVFVVDAAAVIAGKAKDIILEPRDVVYVSPRPWRQAEEIADIAIIAFLRAATATWTGNKVVPIFDDSEKP